MSRTFLSVELEERQIRILEGVGTLDRARVTGTHTVELADDQPRTVAAALAEVAGARRRAEVQVVLLLRNRQVFSGQITDARLHRTNQHGTVIAPAARKLGMFSDNDELTIGYRVRPGTPPSADLSVAPHRLIDGLREALHEFGFRRIRIASAEAALAAGVHVAVDGPICLLDLNTDRALLALARSGSMLVARRFRLPVPLASNGDNSHEIAPLLVGEVTRSLGWFRDQGKGDARMLLVSGPLNEGSSLAQRLEEILHLPTSLVPAPSLRGLPDDPREARGWIIPALGILIPPLNYPALLEPPRLSRREIVAAMTLQAVGLAALAVGGLTWTWAQSTEASQLGQEVEQARRTRDELARQVEARRAELQPLAEVAARRSLLTDLTNGMAPRSALCNILARERDNALLLTKVDLDGSGELKLTGIAQTDDRLIALRALGQLETKLRRIPGLGRGRTALADAKSDGRIAFELSARIEEAKR